MLNFESKIEISNEILNLLTEIDQFKGKWEVYKNLAPERLSALKQVATIESVGSSTRIEGVKLNNKQVEELFQNLDKTKFKSRDEEEVAGYRDAMQLIFDEFNHFNLTENYIKQLHSKLLEYSKKDSKHRGQYKKLSNSVEAFDKNKKSMGIVFETVSPFETPLEMERLVKWTRNNLEDNLIHPLLIIGTFIVTFLAIHPFQDGNGRLSRILTTLLLLKNEYTYVPFSSLERIIEENKDTYYLSLRRTQTSLKEETAQWNPWLLFFFKSLKKQKNFLIEKIEKDKFLLNSLCKLSIQIFDIIKEKQRVSISEIEEATQINRSTLKLKLKKLLKEKYIKSNGKGKGTWYSIY